MFAHFKEYHGNHKKFKSLYDSGDAVSKLQTSVWVLNHITRSITWSLYTLKTSHLVKWPISTWSFMWWCQFIRLLKFETHPSSLLNSGIAYCILVKLQQIVKWNVPVANTLLVYPEVLLTMIIHHTTINNSQWLPLHEKQHHLKCLGNNEIYKNDHQRIVNCTAQALQKCLNWLK